MQAVFAVDLHWGKRDTSCDGIANWLPVVLVSFGNEQRRLSPLTNNTASGSWVRVLYPNEKFLIPTRNRLKSHTRKRIALVL
jgi:hypothetical protein